MTELLSAFRTVVSSARSFVLTTHINPDGDGLGSACALASFLVSRGASAAIINDSATPAAYAFLEQYFPIRQFQPDRDAHDIASADVIVVVDTNHPDRLGRMKEAVVTSPAVKVCIDHHPDPAPFAAHYLIDEDATATGEIVYRLLSDLEPGAINGQTAPPLYTAIMTDTGSFRYPKTDAETHRMVAHLVESGADPSTIYQNVYEQGSANRLQLLGRVLASLRVAHDGRVAYMIVRRRDLEETGTDETDLDTVVSYTMTIAGVNIGMMFSEQPGGVKINFRSKGALPVNALARDFGGNGHTNAAGARINGTTLDAIVARVVDRTLHYLT